MYSRIVFAQCIFSAASKNPVLSFPATSLRRAISARREKHVPVRGFGEHPRIVGGVRVRAGKVAGFVQMTHVLVEIVRSHRFLEQLQIVRHFRAPKLRPDRSIAASPRRASEIQEIFFRQNPTIVHHEGVEPREKKTHVHFRHVFRGEFETLSKHDQGEHFAVKVG